MTYYVGYLSQQVTLLALEDPLQWLSFILLEPLSHCLKICSKSKANLLRLGERWKDGKTQASPSH